MSQPLNPYDAVEEADAVNEEILEVLHDAKVLAKRYYRLTGKPLGTTGEVAEYEAAKHLGLIVHAAREPGYDASEMRNGCPVRVQIKGRCIANAHKING